MDSFNRANLQNIRNIFEKKTGVDLGNGKSFRPFKMVMVTAVMMICCLSTTAFAVSLFSSLSGDDLEISAVSLGRKQVGQRSSLPISAEADAMDNQ